MPTSYQHYRGTTGRGLLIAGSGAAGQVLNANWHTTPVDNDLGRPDNWEPMATPTHTAFVGTFPSTSAHQDLRLTADAIVGALNYPHSTPNPYSIFTNGRNFSVYGAGLTSSDSQGGFHLRIGPSQTTGLTFFRAASSAGDSRITVESGLVFTDSASAGSASINITGSGAAVFYFNATAGIARIRVEPDDPERTALQFFGGRAGSASIDLVRGHIQFDEFASADGARVSIGSGGIVSFWRSSMGSASFTVNTGGMLRAVGSSHGGTARTLVLAGGIVEFDDSARAAGGILTVNSGGTVRFRANASGGTASVLLEPGASIDFNQLTSGSTTLGSLEGPGGTLVLGATALTLGGNDRDAEFGGAISSAGGSLTKGGSGRLTLSGPSALRLYALSVSAGTLAIGPGRSPQRTTILSDLTVASGAQFDLGENDVVVDYSTISPLGAVASLIRSGHADGTWDGDGIVASLAHAGGLGLGFAEAADVFSVFPATFSGVDVDDSAVLVRVTAYGDANLDGTVNLQDFNRLAANFGASGGAVWSQGDFTYDGIVNLQDFNRLAANFGLSAGPDGPTPEDWANLASAVPEPAGWGGVVVIAAIGSAMRRRQRRSATWTTRD